MGKLRLRGEGFAVSKLSRAQNRACWLQGRGQTRWPFTSRGKGTPNPAPGPSVESRGPQLAFLNKVLLAKHHTHMFTHPL